MDEVQGEEEAEDVDEDMDEAQSKEEADFEEEAEDNVDEAEGEDTKELEGMPCSFACTCSPLSCLTKVNTVIGVHSKAI